MFIAVSYQFLESFHAGKDHSRYSNFGSIHQDQIRSTFMLYEAVDGKDGNVFPYMLMTYYRFLDETSICDVFQIQ
jgi:hypothetical protein